VLAAGTLMLFLLVIELRDKLMLKGDLEIARQIQFGLLPFEPYRRPGVEIEAAMRTANTVGGDYFDAIELPEGKLSIVLGDVSGKGMPAALLMALLQGSLRTLLTAGLRGGALIERLNAHLCDNIPSNRLITLFYAELDPEQGSLTYINAGHNFPFVLRASGDRDRLESTAPALGIIEEAEVEERGLEMVVGDRLFIFTDGVTEAFDPSEQEYGEERLERVLVASAGRSARELLEAVERDVVAFCRTSRFRDDMTTMVVTRERYQPAEPS
jgi:serine phosphatase RsbU (regulator of sigma subunit)